MLKKHITPLSKGGQTTVHSGKGSQQAPMPQRGQVKALQNPATNGVNNYAKATPMAQGPTAPDGNLATGDWPGIGM